jgi:hypothetical protein
LLSLRCPQCDARTRNRTRYVRFSFVHNSRRRRVSVSPGSTNNPNRRDRYFHYELATAVRADSDKHLGAGSSPDNGATIDRPHSDELTWNLMLNRKRAQMPDGRLESISLCQRLEVRHPELF